MAAKIKAPINAAAVLLSYFLTCFIFGFFNVESNFAVFIPTAAVIFAAARHTFALRCKRLLLLSYVYSALLSLSFILGSKIDIAEKTMASFGAEDAADFVMLSAFLFFTVSCILDLAAGHAFAKGRRAWGKRDYRILWASSSLLLFLCWLPALLVYYPGNISGDSVACIIRALGKARLSNQQPVFYILLMRPFMLLGKYFKDINFGISCFAFFQLAVVSVSAGYALCRLKKALVPLWAVLAAEAYFIFYPVFSMYSVTLWKDVPFSAFLLLYSLDIYALVENGGRMGRGEFIRFMVFSLILCFLRNNGFIIAAAVMTAVLIAYRQYFKRFAPAFLALLICVPIIQGPVYSACGVLKSPFAESVAVPLQQMARTVKKDGNITAGQKAFLNRLLDEKTVREVYNPLTADNIKFNKNFDNEFLENNKAEFFKTWAGMFPHNVKEYIKAYCLETVGYWHIGTENWVVFEGTADVRDTRENSIASYDLLSGKAGTDLRRAWSCYYGWWGTQPVLSDMLGIGFLFWSAMLSASALIIKKGVRYLLPYLPLVMLWATLMAAAPTFCEYRYMFAFALFLPFGVMLPFTGRQPARKL